MPCYDPRPDNLIPQRKSHGLDIGQLESALCGVFTMIEKINTGDDPIFDIDDVMQRVDWDEAGIPKQFVEQWWKDHKAADIARRKREARLLGRKRK